MQAFADFLEQQENAYANFRRLAEETKRKGIRTDPYFGKYTGFFVNLTHSPDTSQRASAFSRGLARIIPSTAYDEQNVHTTLASSAVLEEGFRVDPTCDAHRTMLEELSLVARKAVHGLEKKQVVVDYDCYLHTDVVAIAAGRPNEAFVELAWAIVQAAQRRSIELRPPWGAHITLARFTGDVPALQLGRFYEFIEGTPPPGRSVPTHVNVGYNVWSWDTENPHATHGGHFVSHISIPLSP